MARAAAANGTPFLHVSTDYVFGWYWRYAGRLIIPPPLNAYGRSKLVGERVCAGGGRPCDPALRRGSSLRRGANFVKTMLRAMFTGSYNVSERSKWAVRQRRMILPQPFGLWRLTCGRRPRIFRHLACRHPDYHDGNVSRAMEAHEKRLKT
jgi:hypothetical protein